MGTVDPWKPAMYAWYLLQNIRLRWDMIRAVIVFGNYDEVLNDIVSTYNASFSYQVLYVLSAGDVLIRSSIWKIRYRYQ
jgi:hypothetical protein